MATQEARSPRPTTEDAPITGEDALAGTGLPEIKRIADPATRERVAMAAESDLEASRYAHWRGTVTFHDVASSWFHMSDPNLSDELRGEFKTLFPGLLDAFAEPRKGIITAYFCRHIRVAAVLTDIGHAAGTHEGVPVAQLKGPPPAGITTLLEQPPAPGTNGLGRGRFRRHRDQTPKDHPATEDEPRWLKRALGPASASSSAIHIEPTFGDPEDSKAKEILFQCLSLHYKALEFLSPQPRKICMRMIFSVITSLLGTLDQRQLERDTKGRPVKPFGADPKEVETLERELGVAHAYYRQATQRQAQLDYLCGMVLFLALAAVILVPLILTKQAVGEPAGVSVLAGAIGAVVSVMNRMSSGSLVLRPESGTKTVRVLGFIRPIIGAVFGASVYAILESGIVDVVAVPSGDEELAFYAAVGFISGFSERFAQDVIAQATPKTPPPPDTARSPASP